MEKGNKENTSAKHPNKETAAANDPKVVLKADKAAAEKAAADKAATEKAAADKEAADKAAADKEAADGKKSKLKNGQKVRIIGGVAWLGLPYNFNQEVEIGKELNKAQAQELIDANRAEKI